jgi:hypothetical protein
MLGRVSAYLIIWASRADKTTEVNVSLNRWLEVKDTLNAAWSIRRDSLVFAEQSPTWTYACLLFASVHHGKWWVRIGSAYRMVIHRNLGTLACFTAGGRDEMRN